MNQAQVFERYRVPATSIEDAIGRCDPDEALGPGDPRRENLDPARGDISIEERLRLLLDGARQRPANPFAHIVFTGHRGSGKSSDLLKFVDELEREGGYLPIYTRVNVELDPYSLSFSDLFLLMMGLLERRFREHPRLQPLPGEKLGRVEDWFKEIVTIETSEVEASVGVEAEAAVGANAPFFAKLLFALRSAIRAKTRQQMEIRDRVERVAGGLLENFNALMDDANAIANEAGFPNGVLFILDNVDRYNPDVVDNVLVKNGELFNAVSAHLIFVVHIAMLYRPPGVSIASVYNKVEMPMIRVHANDASRTPVEANVDRLVALIKRRVSLEALFEDAALARHLARLSGGSLRELMRLLIEALQQAKFQPGGRINAQAVRRAAQELRTEWERQITLEEFDALAKVFVKRLLYSDPIIEKLLFHRWALEYADETGPWRDVSPLLWDSPLFRRAVSRLASDTAIPSLLP